MANENDKIIGDDLLGSIDSVLSEESPSSKLSGVDNEQLEFAPAEDEIKRKQPKKKSKLPLILGGALVLIVGFGGLMIKMDMNKKSQQLVQNDASAEAMLFGEDSEIQGLPAQTEPPFEANPYVNQVDPSLHEQFVTPTQQYQQAQPVINEWEQAMALANQPEAITQQVAPEQYQQQVTTQPASARPDVMAEIQNLNSQIGAMFALINDLSAKQSGIESRINELATKVERKPGANESDLVTRKQFLDSLRSVRSIQAQSEKTVAALKVIEERLGITEAPAVTAKVKANMPSKGSDSRKDSDNSQSAQQVAPTTSEPNQVVVQDRSRRQARELAWSSYIEDFGVATIEGTADLIELRPGDLVLGRGMIEKITPYGCIEFTNKTSYAPTNGECK